jgi:hypothetical protein
VSRDRRILSRWHFEKMYRNLPQLMRGLQRIRFRNTSLTTATYNIKTADDDVHKAMTTLENRIAEARPIQSDTNTTLENNSPV